MSGLTDEFMKIAFSSADQKVIDVKISRRNMLRRVKSSEVEPRSSQRGRLMREIIHNTALIAGGAVAGYGVGQILKPSRNAVVTRFLRSNPDLAVGLGMGIVGAGMFAKRTKDIERERRLARAYPTP